MTLRKNSDKIAIGNAKKVVLLPNPKPEPGQKVSDAWFVDVLHVKKTISKIKRKLAAEKVGSRYQFSSDNWHPLCLSLLQNRRRFSNSFHITHVFHRAFPNLLSLSNAPTTTATLCSTNGPDRTLGYCGQCCLEMFKRIQYEWNRTRLGKSRQMKVSSASFKLTSTGPHFMLQLNKRGSWTTLQWTSKFYCD